MGVILLLEGGIDMNYNGSLLALVLLLGPSSAWAAADFHSDSACANKATQEYIQGTSIVTLRPGSVLYNCQAGGTSNLFFARTGFTIEYDPDLASAGTGTGSVFIVRCTHNNASPNNCEKVLVDNNGDGTVDDEALNGDPGDVAAGTEQRRYIYDLPAGYYRIREAVDEGGLTALITLTSDKE